MSKQISAAKAIKFGIKRGYTPDQIATLLDMFNLLADGLPEPARDMRDPKWQKEYEAAWDDHEAPSLWDTTTLVEVGVFPNDRDITIWYDGEPMEPFTIDEVKSLRLALHAAENYAEIYAENQE
ncbi:hypothetical protein HMPREF2604_07425 [Corynebacterium sp. HMSC055A01]|uniref:hypothetical protein n=1 Tax=Corynebacterium sp. HMSC055A01 TaxID=1715083 RepID=UPI0008A4DB5D|nr:hypothetical protein [Corynebacterium sp. HMSC055A01]OFN17762.1 hypothetical protein HMPREF2604_07425 [Corynebacterium sp. HMSC055A01]